MTEEQYEKINKNAENYLNTTTMPHPVRISSVRNAYFSDSIETTNELQEENERLKKESKEAKEIIRRLMDIINHDLRCFDTMAGLDIKQKAEAFLKT